MSTNKIAEHLSRKAFLEDVVTEEKQAARVANIADKIVNKEIICQARPSVSDAENAVRVLLEYIGEDLTREGLKETPKRVIKSYNELYSGYNIDIADILNKRFFDISSYKDIVLLRDIEFSSLCEHHMLPFYGHVDFAYIPSGYVVGVSKIARLIDAFAKKLQIQEKMTAEIADAFQEHLKPQGVAIRVRASHSCMSTRGARKGCSLLDTLKYTGLFESDSNHKREFLAMLG